MKSAGNRVIIAVLVSVLTTLLLFLLTELLLRSIFDNFEAKTLDWRYAARISRLQQLRKGAPIEDIIIVDIDQRSLDKLGPFQQWPRSYHADIIDFLSSADALAIGFDILFLEPEVKAEYRTARGYYASENDLKLIEATARANSVYHSVSFSDADPNAFIYPMDAAPAQLEVDRFSLRLTGDVSLSLPHHDRLDGKIIGLYNAANGIGYANFDPDIDSVIRKMPLLLHFAGRGYFALSLAIVRGLFNLSPEHIEVTPGEQIRLKIPGGEDALTLTIPIDKSGRMLINYMGSFQTFRYVSYYDILMQRLPVEMFAGKIVLVGTSAAGLYDVLPVPFQGAFPGVEIHANIIYNILTGSYLRRIGTFASYAIFLIGALTVALPAFYFRPRFSIPLALLVTVAYIIIAFHLFTRHGILLEVVRPVLAFLLTYSAVYVYRYTEEDRNKRKIKGMFQYYLSPSVVDELIKNPGMLRLGGERRTATAFFMDIKNFTTYSENLTPEELMAQLNEYLSAMSAIILTYEGYLDKYEGDAIMAIFGVPLTQSDHALRACRAALEMQSVLSLLRKKWHNEGRPQFHARIGINSGAMIAGNIGGEQRFDYTVIGDSVNLASRIEGVNKTYGTSILISEFTQELLEDQILSRELDYIRVKGRVEPVRIYEVIALQGSDIGESRRQALTRFAEGLAAYRRREWDVAAETFEACRHLDPDDGPALVFIKRCRFFKANPVAEDWDGVFEMKSK